LKIEGAPARFLIGPAVWLMKLWAHSLRYTVDDHAGVVGKPVGKNYIGTLWHNQLFLIAPVLRRFIPQRPNTVLVSPSRDGALLAEAVQRFGYQVIRGSSSRLGASAVLQLTNVLTSGSDIGITPDGPRGPAYEVQPGVIFLAQKTGAGIVPVHIEYSKYWRLKSWDGFFVPRPFSKIHVTFGALHWVPPTTSDEEFERERLRLRDAMMQLVKRR